MRKISVSMTNNDQVIDVNNVYKAFKTVQAVNGVSIRINRGQFVALLGPNGAGKTTLVEMIEGIQKPDSGTIRIMGQIWAGHEDKLHRIIGLSLQETRWIEKLTVRETLKLFASFYGLGDRRVSEIIHLVGLEEKHRSYVVNLSGGQRQRLAIGVALINDPEILLLDEPTTGLDPNARREIWRILLDLKALDQTSLILTTHYMEEAEQLCDYIIIIDRGKILKEGTTTQLLEDDTGGKIIEFTLDAPAPEFSDSALTGAMQMTWDAERRKGRVVLDRVDNELPAFFAHLSRHNLRLKNLECRRKTLDDLFVAMTGRRLDE